MKHRLQEFVGMPGTKGKLKGPMVSTITGFMGGIAKHRVASGAGGGGAVTVYRNDAGELCGHRTVYCGIRSTFTGKTKKELREWLAVEWPLCHRAD